MKRYPDSFIAGGMIRMHRNERGVSPVVGVMLMLSVTVIVAAIVSAAAGGLSGTGKKPPASVLEVRFYENQSYGSCSAPAMTIEHISGTPLQTRDLSIATYYRNASGQMIKGGLQGEIAVEGESTGGSFSPGTYSGILYINDVNRFGAPLRGSGAGYGSWFGNASAVLMAGDMLVTPARYCEGNSGRNPALDALLHSTTAAPGSGYRAGTVITTKIVHIPSGQLIFDKDVVVA